MTIMIVNSEQYAPKIKENERMHVFVIRYTQHSHTHQPHAHPLLRRRKIFFQSASMAQTLCLVMTFSMIPVHSRIWGSVMTSGGARRMMCPWVGLARRPSSFSCRHTSIASIFSLMTTALSRPLPRTSVTTSLGSLLSSARSS